MSMTFKQIQDDVIAARFSEAQRGRAKRWINLRGAQAWGMKQWTFKNGTANVSVTTGSANVTNLPADLGNTVSLHRADGQELRWLNWSDFQDLYYAQTATGPPNDFTVQNNTVTVGPVSSETSSTYRLVYQKLWVDLVNDNDVPPLPAEFHSALVHGALATGLFEENDFTADFQENLWTTSLQAMAGDYLSDETGDYDVYGRDPLAGAWY